MGTKVRPIISRNATASDRPGFLIKSLRGISRYQRKRKIYYEGNAIAGYGIYANQDIHAGDVIFRGEEMAQRIVTRRYVEKNWAVMKKKLSASTRIL